VHLEMAALGATSGTSLARCGCDTVQACRGLYVIPMRFSPPRSVVRVAAEAQKSAQGRMKKTKSNAVDANAASLSSALDDAEDRVSSGNVLRSGEQAKPEQAEEKKTPQIPLEQLLMQRLKLDKALDEVVGFMAPREKGDIRDVILMSLSFAVLVYISQRLVCLYCVVRHMGSHTF